MVVKSAIPLQQLESILQDLIIHRDCVLYHCSFSSWKIYLTWSPLLLTNSPLFSSAFVKQSPSLKRKVTFPMTHYTPSNLNNVSNSNTRHTHFLLFRFPMVDVGRKDTLFKKNIQACIIWKHCPKHQSGMNYYLLNLTALQENPDRLSMFSLSCFLCDPKRLKPAPMLQF